MKIRMLSIVSLAFAVFVECARCDQSSNELVSLADLPAIYHGDYKVDPYMEAANRFQAIGKQAAIERLIQLSRSPLAEAEK